MPNVDNFAGEFETGRATVGTTAVQLPDIRCKKVQLRATSGVITIGSSDAVTGTTGFSITSALHPPVMFVDNLSQIWLIANTASNPVEFLVIR